MPAVREIMRREPLGRRSEQYLDVSPGVPQVPRRDETAAAIAARPGEHDYATPGYPVEHANRG